MLVSSDMDAKRVESVDFEAVDHGALNVVLGTGPEVGWFRCMEVLAAGHP